MRFFWSPRSSKSILKPKVFKIKSLIYKWTNVQKYIDIEIIVWHIQAKIEKPIIFREDIWKANGITEGKEYAILTNEIYKEWSGMTASEYKEYKGLRKESRRTNNNTKQSFKLWIHN